MSCIKGCPFARATVAQGEYDAFVAEAVGTGRRPELIGGGLLRSTGKREKILEARKYGEHLKSDDRILGDSDFIEEVLRLADDHLDFSRMCREKGMDVDKLAQMVAQVLGISVDEVWKEGQKSLSVHARDLMCHWARDIGATPTAVGNRLKLSQLGERR